MNDSSTRPSDLPAILGGSPVRLAGPPTWPPDDPAVGAALARAFADGSWGRYHGPHGPALVERLKAYHGVEHAVLCASGTAAVELALRGLKVGPGDEVLLAAYDFEGNFGDVRAVGATPVLVDVRPGDFNLDVSRLDEAVSPKTRAMIVSHLHGGVVPMREALEFAHPRGIAVVEDACQMPGALIDGRRAGTWGDVGVLSFGGSKLLSAGRGGALLTDSPEVVQRARLFSHRGNEAFPLSELQAAVLPPQLDRLDERNAIRARNVARLVELLRPYSGLAPFDARRVGCAHQPIGDGEQHAGGHSPPYEVATQSGYYKLGFRYDPEAFHGLSRDAFAAAMRAEGIALDPGFRALHRTHSRRRYRAGGPLDHARQADDRVLVLHHPVLLGGEEELAQIAAAVDKVARHARTIRARG
ncbi:MAG: aminotransferase class I/II-fold pyridoxal phosphate-dependent enzyme [Planctomycetales bacterium]